SRERCGLSTVTEMPRRGKRSCTSWLPRTMPASQRRARAPSTVTGVVWRRYQPGGLWRMLPNSTTLNPEGCPVRQARIPSSFHRTVFAFGVPHIPRPSRQAAGTATSIPWVSTHCVAGDAARCAVAGDRLGAAEWVPPHAVSASARTSTPRHLLTPLIRRRLRGSSQDGDGPDLAMLSDAREALGHLVERDRARHEAGEVDASVERRLSEEREVLPRDRVAAVRHADGDLRAEDVRKEVYVELRVRYRHSHERRRTRVGAHPDRLHEPDRRADRGERE